MCNLINVDPRGKPLGFFLLTFQLSFPALKSRYKRLHKSWLPILPYDIRLVLAVQGLFPFLYDRVEDHIPYLRCYSDSILNYKTHLYNTNCTELITNVDENYYSEKTLLFPNPTSDLINLKCDQLNFKDYSGVKIYNSFGAEISFSGFVSEKNSIEINVKPFPVGIYFIIGDHFNKKFVVSR